MIDDNIQVKIDALIDTIKESQEYKRYIEIDKVLNKNKEINNLVNDVKKMQQRAVMLEYHKDHRYKKLDDKVIADSILKFVLNGISRKEDDK